MTEEDIDYLTEILFKISEKDAMRVFQKLSRKIMGEDQECWAKNIVEKGTLN